MKNPVPVCPGYDDPLDRNDVQNRPYWAQCIEVHDSVRLQAVGVDLQPIDQSATHGKALMALNALMIDFADHLKARGCNK